MHCMDENDLVEFYVSAKIVDRKHSQMLYIYNNQVIFTILINLIF